MTIDVNGSLSKKVMCVLVCLFCGVLSAYCGGPIEDFEDGDDPGDDAILFVSSVIPMQDLQVVLYDEIYLDGVLVIE